jgi:hypothetical protein
VKHLEFVYFNIYAICQRRNQHLTSLPARLQTMYIISLSAGGWVLLLQAIFLRLVRRAWFSSPSFAMSFAMLVYFSTALLFYRIFIVNNYDEKIYNKYEQLQASNSNKQRALFLSVFVAIVPYLLLLLLKIFFPTQH